MIAPHLEALRPLLSRGDFAPGSRGRAPVDELAPLLDVTVAEVAHSAFLGTRLDWALRHAGIDALGVGGGVAIDGADA